MHINLSRNLKQGHEMKEEVEPPAARSEKTDGWMSCSERASERGRGLIPAPPFGAPSEDIRPKRERERERERQSGRENYGGVI